MVITTIFSIGDPVWSAVGVYQVPVHNMIFAIKMAYNEFGKLCTMYSFPLDPDWWIKEEDLFASKGELNEHLNKNK